LIPTYLHADLGVAGLKGLKAQIAGRKIKFLRVMVLQVVGHVNFPIFPQKGAVRVKNTGGVEILGAVFFKQ
jgi:hypothetical protein